MIVFVTTLTHRYTHTAVERALPMFWRMPYPLLFARRSLPRATYIFSDFDRLDTWKLELAAHTYRVLRAAGCRVLNDPAVVPERLTLLRRLHRLGINSFGAWAADEAAAVDRFPVFVRTAAAHRGNLTEPLGNANALAAALENLIAQGYPLSDLMIVEYRAEPIRDDVFRKMAMYRVGDRFIPAPSVHERNWAAKLGTDGVAGEAGYAEDLDRIRTNPYAQALRSAFLAANIEYGRADFGIVRFRPEVYEINTNPAVSGSGPHHFAARAAALEWSSEAYLSAVRELDTPPARSRVPVPLPELLSRKRLHLLPGYHWSP